MGDWLHRHAIVFRAAFIDLFILVCGDFRRIAPRSVLMDSLCGNARAPDAHRRWSNAHLSPARLAHRI